MATLIDNGQMARCEFGTAPAPVHTSGRLPFATATDFGPFENIHPFGVCLCPGNPQGLIQIVNPGKR